MRSVMFNFRADVSADRQDEVLERVNSWAAVRKASRLKPDAKNALVRCMAYAAVEEDADIEKLVERLSELPEVESASVPAERRLVRKSNS